MKDTASVTKIRLFMSSPGDVEPERAKVTAVVNQVNRMLGDSLGVVLEVVDWKTHVVPDMGRPQEVINQQVGGDYDIFVGILWKRFGTPQARLNQGQRRSLTLLMETGRSLNGHVFCFTLANRLIRFRIHQKFFS